MIGEQLKTKRCGQGQAPCTTLEVGFHHPENWESLAPPGPALLSGVLSSVLLPTAAEGGLQKRAYGEVFGAGPGFL